MKVKEICIEELLRPWYLVGLSRLVKRRSATVTALFFKSVGQYRSSLYETARSLLRSRNNQARRAEEQAQQSRELRLQNEQLTEELQGTEEKTRGCRWSPASVHSLSMPWRSVTGCDTGVGTCTAEGFHFSRSSIIKTT